MSCESHVEYAYYKSSLGKADICALCAQDGADKDADLCQRLWRLSSLSIRNVLLGRRKFRLSVRNVLLGRRKFRLSVRNVLLGRRKFRLSVRNVLLGRRKFRTEIPFINYFRYSNCLFSCAFCFCPFYFAFCFCFKCILTVGWWNMSSSLVY